LAESTGDLFTVYDIPGLVGNPTISSQLATNGFSTFTKQNVGVTPTTTAVPDSATIANLTFPYTSAASIKDSSGSMNLFLGQFSFISTFGVSPMADIFYAAATQRFLPGLPGDMLIANNVSEFVGPTTSAVIPEPPSLLLFGIAIPLAGAFWYVRSRRALRLA
jgi:hypothetical protein